MRDDHQARLADDAYAIALGRAVFAFAALEWIAVQGCERIEPGSVEALKDRTAGRVADTLAALAGALPHAQQRLRAAASRFQALVRSRNNLVHAKPGTDHDGTERLFRDGDPWSIAEMEGIAEAFSRCARDIAEGLDFRPSL